MLDFHKVLFLPAQDFSLWKFLNVQASIESGLGHPVNYLAISPAQRFQLFPDFRWLPGSKRTLTLPFSGHLGKAGETKERGDLYRACGLSFLSQFGLHYLGSFISEDPEGAKRASTLAGNSLLFPAISFFPSFLLLKAAHTSPHTANRRILLPHTL